MTNIIELANKLGFDACNICSAEPLIEESQHFEAWLNEGHAGNMQYMYANREKRCNPQLLLEGAKSVIVVLLNYFPSKTQDTEAPQIAYYAYGNDYHHIIKSKLKLICEQLEQHYPNTQNLICCDTVPLLERALAQRAGLGWIGKSGMLINPSIGSFTFIGCIISTHDFSPFNIKKIEPRCGSCTACIDACPTKAINDNRTINARRCISYNTIENREPIATDIESLMGNRLYGCDECLKACPWNRKAKPHNIAELMPIDGLLNLDWSSFSRSVHKNLLRNSAMQRASYKKLRERLEYINNKK